MDWARFNDLVALSESGKPDEAIPGLKQLAESAEDDQDKAGVLTVLGACQKEAEQLYDAHRTLTQARALAKEDSWVHPRALFFDATIDIRQRKWKDALKKLDEIGRRYPATLGQAENEDLPELIDKYRGIALYKLGRFAEARALLERAAGAEQDQAGALYYVGRCCYDMGDLEAAKDYLRRSLSLELDTDYQPVAHYVLGLAYYWTGQSAWASPEFQWCLENDKSEFVKKWKVLTALMNASKALGLEEDAEKYARMLKKAQC